MTAATGRGGADFATAAATECRTGVSGRVVKRSEFSGRPSGVPAAREPAGRECMRRRTGLSRPALRSERTRATLPVQSSSPPTPSRRGTVCGSQVISR